MVAFRPGPAAFRPVTKYHGGSAEEAYFAAAE